MLRSLLQLFKRPKPRKPAFDGRMSEVNPQGGRIQELLRQFVEQGNPESAKQVLRFVNRRMDDAVRLASNKTYESLMQAHQEAVETETFLLAWSQRYQPEPPAGREKDLLQATYWEILGFIAVMRLSFSDIPLAGEREIEGNHFYVRLENGIGCGPFCGQCFAQTQKAYLLAHSPTEGVHMKCPNCELP